MTPAAHDRHHPYSQRLVRLRAAVREAGLDAFVVSHLPNLRYLTGFDGSLGALLVTDAAAVLIVDGRYLTAVRARLDATPELAGVEVALAERGHEAVLSSRLVDGAARQVGVEGAALTLARFDRLKAAVRSRATELDAAMPELRATERVVERLRLVKDDVEIAIVREAARRLSTVARDILPELVYAGRTEGEVAADIDHAVRRAGFERPAFETIVASGPNGALPHARPGDRRLQPGDGVVLDFGGVYDGYCVDLTRTVQLAPLDEAFGRLFEAVQAAQAAAIAAVRPGVRAAEIDAAAREVLVARGLGDAFVHSTGHGLGLEIHEEPRVAKSLAPEMDEVLGPGMIFTVEPGVYVPGIGGVRIEDDVVVVEQGCEVLTDVPIDRTGRGGRRAAGA